MVEPALSIKAICQFLAVVDDREFALDRAEAVFDLRVLVEPALRAA